MITIHDIAQEAGVSKTTVSRVLNNSSRVSDKTRLKIEEVINKYDYQPSESARALCQKTTKMIGVIIPNIYNDFYHEVMQGITQVADESKMSLLFCNTMEDPKKEENAMTMLKGQRVRGVIMALARDNPDRKLLTRVEEQIKELNAPVVFLDRKLSSSKDAVTYDGFGASYRATTELIKAGNKTLGIITGDINLKIGKERLDGFIKAMEDHQVEVNDEYIFYGNFMLEKAYELSRKMYESGKVPDGIVTCNNDSTLGFIRATREQNFKLGREIALVAIDHVTVLDTIGYHYSHVGRDSVGTGRNAMSLLLKKIEEPKRKVEEIVMPYYVQLMGTEKKSQKDKKKRK